MMLLAVSHQNPLHPSTLKALLATENKPIKKSLGQHYLIDGNILNKLLLHILKPVTVPTFKVQKQEKREHTAASTPKACSPHPKQPIIELGAGLGTLTQGLLSHKKDVIAVEIEQPSLQALERLIDKQNVNLYTKLPPSFQGTTSAVSSPTPNLYLVHANMMHCNWFKLLGWSAEMASWGKNSPPPQFTWTGNLPYSLATRFILELLEQYRPLLAKMVFMVQEEVAMKLRLPVASGSRKTYGVGALLVNWHATVTKNFTIAPNAFYPKPRVKSAVITLTPHESYTKTERTKAYYPLYKYLVKGAFSHRRKTLTNALSYYMATAELPVRARPALPQQQFFEKAVVRSAVSRALDVMGIAADVRAEKLSLADYIRLTKSCAELLDY